MAERKLSVSTLHETRDRVIEELANVLVGQEKSVDQVLTAFFAGGHCMIMGMPGVAKTLLIASLSQIMDLAFKRIQFTPDLMPSDITGSEILEEDKTTGHRELKFVKGPVFANIVMADEINRTPPKTQAALLEAMQEKQVTLGGKTHLIDPPFFVLATQIPIEQEGTYPLPEAQQDRFMFSVVMTYLSEDQEVEVVRSSTGSAKAELKSLLGGEELLAYQTIIRDVEVPAELSGYIVDLVAATRPGTPVAPDFVNDYVSWGAGLRASQYIVLGAKSKAALSGRTTANVDDVRAVVVPSMRHRIGLNFRADVDKVGVEDIVARLAEKIPAPALK